MVIVDASPFAAKNLRVHAASSTLGGNVRVHCSGYLKDGRLCNHVVATIPIDEWEEQRKLGTTLECRRCGRVEKLATFM